MDPRGHSKPFQITEAKNDEIASTEGIKDTHEEGELTGLSDWLDVAG